MNLAAFARAPVAGEHSRRRQTPQPPPRRALIDLEQFWQNFYRKLQDNTLLFVGTTSVPEGYDEQI